jgi:hypothetical protein
METPIEFGICNGEDVQMIDDVDLDQWTRVETDGTPVRQFALLRGHIHPGEKTGDRLRGVAADVNTRSSASSRTTVAMTDAITRSRR